MATPEQGLIELVSDYAKDPLNYVRVMFPWGKGSLSGNAGPRVWQADILDTIGSHLRSSSRFTPLLISVASGHGVGKLTGSCVLRRGLRLVSGLN